MFGACASAVPLASQWAKPVGDPWDGSGSATRPREERGEGLASGRQRPRIQPQIGADAVGAGEAAEGNRVEPLAGEAGIANAVEAADAGAVEGHRQEARQSHRRDGAIAAAAAAKEAAMAAGSADLPVGDGAGQARQDCREAGDQAVGVGFLLGGIGRGGKATPGLHGGGGEGVHDVVALRG